MPSHCCVPLCKQRGIIDSDGKKVSFHRFPKDIALRKKWIIAIKRDEGPNFKVSEYTKVCSKHFRVCDYIPGVASGHNILRDTAVPSVFNFAKQRKQRKPPKQRAALPARQAAKLQDQLLPVQDLTPNAPQQTPPDSSDGNMDVQTGDMSEHAGADHAHHEKVEHLVAVIDRQDKDIRKLRDECSHLREQLQSARAEIQELRSEKDSVTQQLNVEKERTSPFCIDRFKQSDEALQFYTGLPSYEHFTSLLVFLEAGDGGCNVLRAEGSSATRGRKRKLSTENQLFLVLVRLRLGLFETDLAHRFGITQSTVSRICTSWLNFLYGKLGTLPLWASRKVVDDYMPVVFVGDYASTRVILDATEIRCEVPSSLSLQSSTYSSYKSSNTFKGLIGVSPNGLVTFVSELFTRSTSDRECVVRSGFLELDFEENDGVMADKGFVIEDLLESKGVKLNIPPFLRGGTFSKGQVQETKEIASLRIHVERRIQRIKGYHIFDRPIPLTLAPVINQIWTVAAILTNFQTALIQRQSNTDVLWAFDDST